MKIKDNHVRAQKVVATWPSWKQGYTVTKHSCQTSHEKLSSAEKQQSSSDKNIPLPA